MSISGKRPKLEPLAVVDEASENDGDEDSRTDEEGKDLREIRGDAKVFQISGHEKQTLKQKEDLIETMEEAIWG